MANARDSYAGDIILTRLRAVVVDQFYGEDQLAVTDAADEIERLRAQVDRAWAEIERLRAAGDALADMHDEWDAIRLIKAWQEARRG